MSQLGVFLARQELRVIFDHFDQNKDGNIAYAEFVGVLRVSAYLPSLLSFVEAYQGKVAKLGSLCVASSHAETASFRA